jgi:hypothetical protein
MTGVDTARTTKRSPVSDNGLTPEAFQESFDEKLADVLDVNRWRTGVNLDDEYRRIEQEVGEAVAWEDDLQKRVREEVHPKLWSPGAPKGAGHYKVPLAEIKEIHRGLLFPGGVEACDGSSQVHDTLPLTIHQIAVSLVSYHDDSGSWHTRLFRRDLRQRHDDPIAETLELLQRRSLRGAQNHDSVRDGLSELARRGIMSYAERAILVRKAKARWRMGHGNPAEYQFFISSYPELMIQAIRLLRELIEGHKKFVFVSSEPADRMLLTIGHALHPLEFAVVGTLADQMHRYLGQMRFTSRVSVDASWDGEKLSPDQWVARFRDDLAARVIVGVYRATRLGPAQVFYAHEDYAQEAARIALADSVLQEHRGFPLLIDLADKTCKSIYGGGSLQEMATNAYAAAGLPSRYLSERMSRE